MKPEIGREERRRGGLEGRRGKGEGGRREKGVTNE